MDLPDGWTAVVAEGPGPFVTRARLRRPDGSIVSWRSRAHRKRPGRLAAWMSGLFAAGSVCFAAGAIASQWGSSSLETAIGVTFFVGSLLFTSAAFLQWLEAVNVSWRGEGAADPRRRWRPASWEPRRIDWLASLVQLAGTVFFNVSTFAALKHGLDTRQTNLRVWTPDVAGSVCFLVASVLAYAEVCGRWVCWRVRSVPWWITSVNLLGSIWFGLAAIGAVIEPSTNEPLAARLDNVGTALGAICFFVGALLLVPEARGSSAQPATA
jgi:hypothetical protein